MGAYESDFTGTGGDEDPPPGTDDPPDTSSGCHSNI